MENLSRDHERLPAWLRVAALPCLLIAMILATLTRSAAMFAAGLVLTPAALEVALTGRRSWRTGLLAALGWLVISGYLIYIGLHRASALYVLIGTVSVMLWVWVAALSWRSRAAGTA